MVVVKDDEEGGINEQKQKYEQIIEILLSAGYFRARISALSEFDKVVGGLCWAIVNSGVEVDVDILFTENATIGQRIALSEAIVSAMRKMKCPHNLQPHQIQGGIGGADYIVILPVIVWLINKFFVLREERDIQLRSFSTLQFSRNYKFPHETEINEVTPEMAKILGRNKVIRKYRRPVHFTDAEEKRVHSCLLEYGDNVPLHGGSKGGNDGKDGKRGNTNGDDDDATHTHSMHVIGSGGDVTASGIGAVLGISAGAAAEPGQLSGFEKKLMQEALRAEKEEALYNEMQSKEASELMESMQSLEGASGLVGGSLAGALLGLGGGDISNASLEYLQQLKTSQEVMEKNLQGGKLGQAAAFKRQRQTLMNKQAEINISLNNKEDETGIVLEKLRLIEEEALSAREYNTKLQAQIAKLEEMEKKSSQQSDLASLKGLIMLNENLKGQEAAFKQSCKTQMAEYKARIAALKEANTPTSDENKKLQDIEDLHAKIMLKYNKLRQLLAEMNLEVSANVRVIDDIPTRTELIQYERRFGELYQQVAWKLKETKKYYDMYNTMASTLEFMQKNVSIVGGIHDNFKDAMRSRESRQSFLEQVHNITKGVTATLNNEENKVILKSKLADELKAQHQSLVAEQRAYYQAIKDFQTECEKNDWLTAKIENAQAQTEEGVEAESG